MFEFEVLCMTYDYLEDSQKLKLFPSTVKGVALKWFNHKDEVFKMMQREDESLEYLIERFNYNFKRTKMNNLDGENLKDILLKAIRDEWIGIINMMGKGDISQLPLSDIGELCVHLSRGKSKIGKGPRDHSLVRENKSATRSLSRAEIGNMLNEFKTDILGSLSEQLDTLKIQNKQKTEADSLAIFCSKCRKKHTLR